ncbi:MAG: prolipoprotein diacylglyceryl transferase [bacterium]|nr:prolipoprotein diacylglyceryl transferase [bacterium]
MKPVLFEIGHYAVSSYSFLVMLSVLLGGVIVFQKAKQDGRTIKEIVDVTLVMFLSALIGAKLFHVLFEAKGHLLSTGDEAAGILDLLKDDPWHWARLFDPGYVFYGGFLVAALITAWYLRLHKVKAYWAYGDYVALALALGVFLGRIGCLLGGCCYGSSAPRIFWAVVYPTEPLIALGPVHPTPLYDAFFGLIAWALLSHFFKRKRFHGEILLWFTLSYSLWRFGTEFYRGDVERGIFFSLLSSAQIISLVVFVVSFCFLCKGRLRSSLDNWLEV